MRKSILTTVLSLMLVLTLVLSACSQGENTSDESKGTEETSEETAGETSSNKELSFPLEEPVTLEILMPINSNITDIETNDYTKWLEEKTNIDFKFQTASESEFDTVLNLALSGGTYPDIIISNSGWETIALYADLGIYQPVTELMKEYSPECYKLLSERGFLNEIAYKGEIYSFPAIEDCYHCGAYQKYNIYKPWLDKLGLDLPETVEEFKAALTAFATQDPNGNGEADEIPFTFSTDGWGTRMLTNVLTPFGYADADNGFKHMDGDKVQIAYYTNQQGFKEGMEYARSLVADGLFDTNGFVQTTEDIEGFINTEVPTVGAFSSGALPQFVYNENNRWEDYVVLPTLEGPAGRIGYTGHSTFVEPAFMITDKCENPEVAAMLAGLMFTDEGSINRFYGQKGRDWDWGDEGAKGLFGEPSVWKELIKWDQVQDNAYWLRGPNNQDERISGGRQVEDDGSFNLEVALAEETRNKQAPYFDETKKWPLVFYFSEDSEDVYTIESNLNSYLDEWTTTFLLSDDNIEDVWPEFIETVEQIGVQRVIDVYQEAYDSNK